MKEETANYLPEDSLAPFRICCLGNEARREVYSPGGHRGELFEDHFAQGDASPTLPPVHGVQPEDFSDGCVPGERRERLPDVLLVSAEALVAGAVGRERQQVV